MNYIQLDPTSHTILLCLQVNKQWMTALMIAKATEIPIWKVKKCLIRLMNVHEIISGTKLNGLRGNPAKVYCYVKYSKELSV
jgi:hypothetical protein